MCLKKITGRLVIVMLLIYYGLFFTAYIIPSPVSKGILGVIKMEEVLDLKQTGYSHDETMEYMNKLEKKGRSVYLRNLWTVDFFIPLVSAVSFFMLIFYCVNRTFGKRQWLLLLSLIPFFTLFFDYSENFLLTLTIMGYPNVSVTHTSIASFCTRAKWLSINVVFIVSIVMVIVFIICSLYRKIRKVQSN